MPQNVSIVQPNDSDSKLGQSNAFNSLFPFNFSPVPFSKESLLNLQIIGQVDTKFIACRMSPTSSMGGEDLLIFFDQHAVDERIKLEELTKSFVIGKIRLFYFRIYHTCCTLSFFFLL